MEWNTENYEKHSDIQTRIGIKNIESLNPKENEHILDLGCGRANLTLKIASLIGEGKVIGIDKDKNMIDAARKSIEKSGINNIEIISMNANQLDYQSKFDAVFANIVLHWIKDLSALLRKIYLALKDTGRISFAMLYHNTEQEKPSDKIKIQKYELDQFQYYLDRGHHTKFLPNDDYLAYQKQVDPELSYAVYEIPKIQKTLEDAGFVDIKIEKEFVPNNFVDEESYFAYRDSNIWQYFFAYFPENVREKIKEDLIKLILNDWEKVPLEKREYPIHEEWPVLFVTAKKSN